MLTLHPAPCTLPTPIRIHILSIMKMKQEKYFDNRTNVDLKLKRREINDWIDRSFGRVICMIPARAGSERLKLKNMRLLAGKPLIQYAIEKVG